MTNAERAYCDDIIHTMDDDWFQYIVEEYQVKEDATAIACLGAIYRKLPEPEAAEIALQLIEGDEE